MEQPEPTEGDTGCKSRCYGQCELHGELAVFIPEFLPEPFDLDHLRSFPSSAIT